VVHEITAVLVSWRDGRETIAAIESLADARARVGADGPAVSLVVVDNGGEGAVGRRDLLERWPGATLLVNAANRGFGPAVNQAAAAASGDVLLILNPDTRAEDEPFSEIARAFGSAEGVVAVAPRLVDEGEGQPEGLRRRLQPPGREDQFTFQLRRLPRLRDDARELLLFDHVLPNNPARRRFRYADRDPESPLDVEQPAASALAVSTDAFRAVGGFDETLTPAWFEDVDLCARLRERGTILYWPFARFRHRGGAAAGALGYGRFLPTYYRKAIRYRRRRYGRAARLGYRALLTTGMLLRLAALPLRPRPTRPRRESARAYLGTLAVALGLTR
jgi:GT2 family glycosyltransferase